MTELTITIRAIAQPGMLRFSLMVVGGMVTGGGGVTLLFRIVRIS